MSVRLSTFADRIDPNRNGKIRAMLEKLQVNILKPHERNLAQHMIQRLNGPPAQVRAVPERALVSL